MAELKEKVLLALHNGKQLEITLDDISKSQENLLKNHSNPVFCNKDKNKILEGYTDLQNLGKSLNRYGVLKENNYLGDAKEEKENIENNVLKGGISYYKYVWHAENSEYTCDKCKELDGQMFNFYDEVPQRPHPNCRCTVDVVENNEENPSQESNENDEPSDYWNKIEILVENTNILHNEIKQIFSELNNMEEEDFKLLNEIKNFKQQVEVAQLELANVEPCSENCVAYLTGMAINITDDKKLENIMENISNLTNESRQVYQIFLEHKHEMEETKDGMDKYYHAKANCTSAELGFIQTLWAIVYSFFKEVKDFYYKVFKYHMGFKAVAIDCLQDLKADLYGIQKAKEHGYCSDKVKDVYKDVFNK